MIEYIFGQAAYFLSDFYLFSPTKSVRFRHFGPSAFRDSYVEFVASYRLACLDSDWSHAISAVL